MHRFSVDGVTKRATKASREERLARLLHEMLDSPPTTEGMSICYAFYNVDKDRVPCVVNDPEYPESVAALVTRVIL
jgi:hypothetical protein